MTKRNLVYFSLSLFTVTAAFFLFYFWQKLLINPFALVLGGDKKYLVSMVLFALSAVLFLSFDSLFNLLVENQMVRLTNSALIALIFAGIMLFMAHFGQVTSDLKILAIASFSALALFFALLIFSHLTKKAIAEHLSFKAGHVLGPGFNIFVTLLGLILAGQYFLAAQANLSSFKFEIPDALLNEAFNLTEQMLGGQLNPAGLLPGQVQGEFDQNLFNQLPSEVLQLIPLIQQNQLPPEIKEEIKKNLPAGMDYEQFKQMVQNIPIDEQGQINVHPDSQAFRSDYLTPVKEQVLNQVNTLIEPYKPYLPLVFAVLFFLILKSFGFIINALAVLVLSIFIWIFKVTGLAQEKTLSVEARRLELKE